MTTGSYLSWGRVSGAHGVDGNFKIIAHADDPAAFAKGVRLLLEKPEKDRCTWCTVRWCQPHGRFFLVACKEITTREEAQRLAGFTVSVSRDDLPELEEDTYYWEDIIGLGVVTAEMKFLGRIIDIIPTGGNDVYVVYDKESQQEILLPAVKSVVKKIDVAAGIIQVVPPDTIP